MESSKQEQFRRFFEAHVGPLPARDQVSVRCPFHDDRCPSLSLNLRDGLWKCHAGCGEGGLIDFQMKVSGVDQTRARELVNAICGATVFGGKQPEAVYIYRDAIGRPVFEKLRYPGKDFRNRRLTGNGYVWNLDGIQKPLYNLPEVLTADEVLVCEGEKDADNVTAALRSVGSDGLHVAATTNFGGAKEWDDDYNAYFKGKRVFILADNDNVGRQHAEKIAAGVYPFAYNVKVINLPGLADKGDVSDFLATHSAADLVREIKVAERWSPGTAPELWRSALKSYEELEQGEFEFLIDRFLPRGITFLGGLPESGKSWLALSIAKALVGGQPFLKKYRVPHPITVLYLAPESGERAFRIRLEAMRLTVPGELFLCRTIGSGPTLALDSPELLGAVRALQPVVMLDTAIRFSEAQDENSATQNQKLANQMFGLLAAGAKGIVAIHHATKSSANEGVTLENSLRGTGDFAAMADAAYSLRCVEQETLTITVTAIKGRDLEKLPPFKIQGRPFINEIGDFALLADLSAEERLVQAICDDPTAGVKELAAATRISKNRIVALAESTGWTKVEGKWVQEKTKVQ